MARRSRLAKQLGQDRIFHTIDKAVHAVAPTAPASRTHGGEERPLF